MTKEDWNKVEQALSGVVGHAKLKVDGREVTFARCRVSRNRLGIGTYVDGEIQGAWLFPKKPTPESRYMRPMSKWYWTAESRKRMKKLSKRYRKQNDLDPDKKQHYLTPLWPNATAIRRHYQKTFESIELIEATGVPL